MRRLTATVLNHLASSPAASPPMSPGAGARKPAAAVLHARMSQLRSIVRGQVIEREKERRARNALNKFNKVRSFSAANATAFALREDAAGGIARGGAAEETGWRRASVGSPSAAIPASQRRSPPSPGGGGNLRQRLRRSSRVDAPAAARARGESAESAEPADGDAGTAAGGKKRPSPLAQLREAQAEATRLREAESEHLRRIALLERENGRVQGRLADMTKKWANALMQVRELQASLDNRDRLRKEEHQAQVAEVASLRAELSGAKPPPEQQQAAGEKKGGGCFGGLFSCFGGGPAVVSERQTRRPSWVERV